MKYNLEHKNIKTTQEKLEQITQTEQSQKAKAIIDSAANSTNVASDRISRKNYTLYLREDVMEAVEVFLKEFGDNKESKGVFVEKAILSLLETRKQNLKQMLQEKLKKLDK